MKKVRFDKNAKMGKGDGPDERRIGKQAARGIRAEDCAVFCWMGGREKKREWETCYDGEHEKRR